MSIMEFWLCANTGLAIGTVTYTVLNKDRSEFSDKVINIATTAIIISNVAWLFFI